MKPIKLTLCLLLLFFVAACQMQDEIPAEPKETQRRIVSSADIPQVTLSLMNQLGLRNGGKRFSVYSEGNAVGVAIDWDKVKQLIDTTGKQTYTFAIEDQDNDPKTFYNLIFQLTPENEPYQPYLMKYTMDSVFAQSYYSGQLDFNSFQGSVSKIRIQGFGNTVGSSFNDDGEEVLMGEGCPGDTQINSNSPGTSGVPIDEESFSGYDPEDNWMCEVFIQETDWWTCVSGGGSTYCRITETTYEITYENCGSGSAMSSSDDDGFCQPTDDNIPIIEPELWEIQIDDSLLKPCMQSILANLKGLSQGIAWVVNGFDVSGTNKMFGSVFSNYDWKLKDGIIANPNQTASTSPILDSNGMVVTAFATNKYTNASDLSIARTILHESLHAYMVVELKTNAVDYSTNFPKLWKDYIARKYGDDLEAYQHAAIAETYVWPLAATLKEYGEMQGYSLPYQFYGDMAWAGLQGTQAFSGLSTAVQQRIMDVISVEFSGLNTNGNQVTKKGNNGGC